MAHDLEARGKTNPIQALLRGMNEVWMSTPSEPAGEMYDLVTHEKLVAIVAQLCQTQKLSFHRGICRPKLPGTAAAAFPLHQDSHHRGYGTARWEDVNGRGSFVQTATLIDRMTQDNGPLLFVPGSNQQCHLGLPTSQDEWPEGIDLSGAVTVIGDPGDVAVFGPYTLHGSRLNTSTVSRRIFINGYAYPGANRYAYVGEGAGRLLRR